MDSTLFGDTIWLSIISECDTQSLLSLIVTSHDIKDKVYVYLRLAAIKSTFNPDISIQVLIYLRHLGLQSKSIIDVDDKLTPNIHKDIFKYCSIKDMKIKESLTCGFIMTGKHNLLKLCIDMWSVDLDFALLINGALCHNDNVARDIILSHNPTLDLNTCKLLADSGVDYNSLMKNSNTLKNVVKDTMDMLKPYYKTDPLLLNEENRFTVATAACLYDDAAELSNLLIYITTKKDLEGCISTLFVSNRPRPNNGNCLPLLIMHPLFDQSMIENHNIEFICTNGWYEIMDLILNHSTDYNAFIDCVFKNNITKDDLKLLSLLLKHDIDLDMYLETARKKSNRAAIVMINRRIKEIRTQKK